MTVERSFVLIAALSALVAVAAGAYAAHGLAGRVDPSLQAIFETAARYQMYHALGLLMIAPALALLRRGLAIAAGWCMVGGTILFSGSLYALVLAGDSRFGHATPFGGLTLMAGWALLAAAAAAGPSPGSR